MSTRRTSAASTGHRAANEPAPTPSAEIDGSLTPPVSERALGWILAVCGAVGAAAAFVLIVEKIELLRDSSYVPTCSINPILSCGSVMTTEQAAVFGFPNPLLSPSE